MENKRIQRKGGKIKRGKDTKRGEGRTEKDGERARKLI